MASPRRPRPPSAPAHDLVAFFRQHQRLPRLGDDVAPWRYRGWLLAYVIEMHRHFPAVADRWGYHLRTLEAGRLLDEPIPPIRFSTPNSKVFTQLRDWSALVGRDTGGWSDFRTLLDWLLWGLALGNAEPRLSEAINEKLYRSVDLGPMLERPYDYLGDYVAAGKTNGWNPTAFFPTPPCVVDLMVQMTMADSRVEEGDSRLHSVCDPCVGSGRMLLHASNFSFRLFGQDIDPLAVAMCKVNGALYAPWLSFPLPDFIIGTRPPEPTPQGPRAHSIHNLGQKLLFDE